MFWRLIERESNSINKPKAGQKYCLGSVRENRHFTLFSRALSRSLLAKMFLLLFWSSALSAFQQLIMFYLQYVVLDSVSIQAYGKYDLQCLITRPSYIVEGAQARIDIILGQNLLFYTYGRQTS